MKLGLKKDFQWCAKYMFLDLSQDNVFLLCAHRVGSRQRIGNVSPTSLCTMQLCPMGTMAWFMVSAEFGNSVLVGGCPSSARQTLHHA
jgi:hypothetical protein